MRLIVNAQTGQIVQQANYSSFGETTFKSGDFISLGFAGGITDSDSDLVRFGARDFDPKTGRWTTKDPIRFDGDGINIYRYVNNDPVNLIDPNGEFVIFPVVAIGLGAAVVAIGSYGGYLAGTITAAAVIGYAANRLLRYGPQRSSRKKSLM